jgi:hypothetical protein
MLRENSLRSASSSIVGRRLGSELIANPNSTSWMIGMPTIIPNVSRSRFSWMNSLPTMPSQRENEKKSLMSHGTATSSAGLSSRRSSASGG